MYVLVLFALFVGPNGPVAITRPEIEYYQSEEACKQFGLKHVKEFSAGLAQEPLLMAGKCVKVKELEGDPA